MTTSPTLSSQQDPDADLVRRCQAGGPDASLCFERLLARHAASIKRRAARILGDESEAEDVVQDVFLNVYRFLHRYRPDRPFSHWLSIVTLNACRIELRRRGGRDRRHEAYRLDPCQPRTSEVEVDPILRSWLDRELGSLNPLTRTCILLRAVDGLSYRELAERTGLSEPAAKMRVLRGLRELRSSYPRDEVGRKASPAAAQPASRARRHAA